MKKIILVIFLFSFTFLCFTQNEASKWYFGKLSGLDFRNGPPMLLRDGQIETNEGCSSMSDNEGNLLFYTNGSKIWNKNHEIMSNGENLFGHWSSSNSSIIIPKPNSTNIYYLVTVDEPSNINAEFYPNPNPNPLTINPFDETTDSDDGLNNGLNYSVIDMNLNDGLGEVISKNIHLITYDLSDEEQLKYKCSEKLTAIYNSDGSEIWFLTHFIDKFYTFKVDENGIDTNPIVSTSGYSMPTSGYTYNAIGCIKFSPNGKKLAVTNNSYHTEPQSNNSSDPIAIGSAYLFDFDNSTGIISNGLQILNEGNPYGVEFSPDSRVLYLHANEYDSFGSDLFQFDLTASDITNSKYRAWGASSAGALQLGIDGVIYIAMPNFDRLSRVTNPNVYGSDVNVTWFDVWLDGFDTPYRSSKFGLPNYIQNFFEQNITFENLCFGEETNFKLINYTDVISVQWDFGENDSGDNNESSELEPTHNYNFPGIYEVSAFVLYADGSEKLVTRELEITETPIAYQIEDIYVCEQPNTSYSNWTISFPAVHVPIEVLGGQENMRVTFNEGNSAENGKPISELGSDAVFSQETITVRVAQKNNPLCYDETTFMVIVVEGALAFPIDDIYACDSDNDGYAEFNLSSVDNIVAGNQTDVEVIIYDGNGNLVALSSSETYFNSVPFNQTLLARVTDTNAQCIQEVSFNLITETGPMAYPLQDIIGCDDDNDGISEYFDTSSIENTIIGDQTGMELSYYNESGELLPNPLPNPYTNSIPNQETIIVRVASMESSCYTEASIIFRTSNQPQINDPQDIYGCNEENGYTTFDLSYIENEIVGNQLNLNLYYFDSIGNEITGQITSSYVNFEPWTQTIYIRVEDEFNSLCFSETSFNLFVNELPQIDLNDSYFLCDLEPSITLSVNPDYNNYEWYSENDDTIIATNNIADIINEGNYTLTVSQTENNIVCENSFSFNIVRSSLPEIEQVNYGELGNNYIEIVATGDGDFEYSIDGINYQDSNYFDNNIQGGTYTVYVRDKEGCGEDIEDISIIDYPKFLTPNNDGYNDYWQIKGITQFQNSKIFIFDRYGKLLKQLSPNNLGWDGSFNGKKMPSNDYWFTAYLGNGNNFSGHFTLKR